MALDNQAANSPAAQVAQISGDLPLREAIERAGRLLDASDRAMPQRFCFQWQNIDFTVTPAGPHGAGPAMIEARLGHLPYSAEDAAARGAALKLAAPDAPDTPHAPRLPGRLQIDRHGVVRLVMETAPIETAGLAAMLKEVTLLVLLNAGQLKRLRRLLVD